MKTYWRLLGFAKPIEKYAIPYFFCTLLYAFFNVCTFTLIMPIVNSLFSERCRPLPRCPFSAYVI